MTIRLAIVNDYEVVVHGLASMLRSYNDRIEVVEVDANSHPASEVDIALFDTFAQSFRDRARIARLVSWDESHRSNPSGSFLKFGVPALLGAALCVIASYGAVLVDMHKMTEWLVR